MNYRDFGKTGLKVSEIGFGGSRVGGVFAEKNGSNQALYLLRKALDEGITFYDTADMYSQGESESLIGQAFHDRRDRVIIASKGGYTLPTQRKLISRLKPLVRPLIKALGLKRENLPSAVSGSLSQDFSGPYLVQALEASLRRLKTDYLDLYQLHSPPAEVIQSGDFLETLESLKQQGKIRFYGITADSAEDAKLCLKWPQISSIQLPFGLLDPEALTDVFPDADAQGVGIIARGCFGGGMLKDSLTEAQLEEMTPNWKRVLSSRRIAAMQKRPVLEMALQFALAVRPISVTLLGMRTDSHLADNLRFYGAPPLSEAEYSQIVQAES